MLVVVNLKVHINFVQLRLSLLNLLLFLFAGVSLETQTFELSQWNDSEHS